MADKNWGWFGNRSSGEGIEFESPVSSTNWGWFGNRSSGEGLEFSAPEVAWTNHAWDRGSQFIMAAEVGGTVIVTADLNASGVATDSLIGRAIWSTNYSFTGTATDSLTIRALGNAVYTAAGTASDSIISRTVWNAVYSAQGLATDSLAARSLYNVTYNSAGLSSDALTANALFRADLGAVGVASDSLVGGSVTIVTADLNASGLAVAMFDGEAITQAQNLPVGRQLNWPVNVKIKDKIAYDWRVAGKIRSKLAYYRSEEIDEIITPRVINQIKEDMAQDKDLLIEVRQYEIDAGVAEKRIAELVDQYIQQVQDEEAAIMFILANI